MSRLTLILLLLPVLAYCFNNSWGTFDPATQHKISEQTVTAGWGWVNTIHRLRMNINKPATGVRNCNIYNFIIFDYRPRLLFSQEVNVITMIEVIDNNDNGLRSEIVDGGLGADFMQMELKSVPLRTLNATVRVYGYTKKV